MLKALWRGALAALVGVALAQSVIAGTYRTKDAISAEISNDLPTNHVGAVTATIMRSLLGDMASSYQQAVTANVQTVTSYAVGVADFGSLLIFTNSGNVAVSVPSAASFNPFSFFVNNSGLSTVTLTPSSGSISGAATLALSAGASAMVVSDGFNWQVTRSVVATSLGSSGLTRSQIPSASTLLSTFTVTGYRTANDLGAGCTYTSTGATSNGLEAIQSQDGTWYNLTFPNGVASVGCFGAYADDGAQTISSGDISANPQWRGTYTAGLTWDYVATQEAIYASFAGASTPGSIVWNAVTPNISLNQELFVPNGVYGINHQILMVAQGGKATFQSKGGALWIWTGTMPMSGAMWLCDACSYMTFTNPSLEVGPQSYGSAQPAWSLDWTGTYATLKTQQDTITGAFISVDMNGQGIAISPGGGGSQGDTIAIINSFFGGNLSDWAVQLGGANTLEITFTNSDIQGFPHDGIQIIGGSIHAEGTHAENQDFGQASVAPVINQLTTQGADVHVTSAVNGSGPSVIKGWRGEAEILASAVGNSGIFTNLANGIDIIGSNAQGADFNNWAGTHMFQQGALASGGTKGRVFMLVEDGGTSWAPISSGTPTTITDNAASYTVNQWVGYAVLLRYGSNGFFANCNITANTATTITFDGCGGFDTESMYKISGLTGGVEPTWDSVAQGFQSPLGAFGQSFQTQAGSNCVGIASTIFSNINVNDYVVISFADQIAPGGSAPTMAMPLYAKVTGKAGGACPGGYGTDNLTVSKNAAFSGVNGGYYGTPTADGTQGVKWINAEYDLLRGTNVAIDIYGKGLVMPTGSIQQFANQRSDWQDLTYGINNTSQNILFDWGARSAAMCNALTPASTINLTTTLLTCNAVAYTPTGDTTFNAPAPVANISQQFDLLITTSGVSSFTMTFGTNFTSSGPLATGTTSGAELQVLFRSDGTKWVEIARFPSNQFATIQPSVLYSAAGTALPSCTAGLNGTRAVVSDATAPTYRGSYTSGGAVTAPVICNGGTTTWLTD